MSCLEYLVLYFPLGVIGAWRWSTWLIRVLFGLRYRAKTLSNFQNVSVSVVIPVYGEPQEHFWRVLESIAVNKPHEIIAVIDHEEISCIEVFRNFQQRASNITTILSVTEVPGKRTALKEGIEQATGEIVALVDADTVWAPDFLKHAVAPFADSEIQAVTVCQKAWNPQNIWMRLQNIFWNWRYAIEMRFLSAAGSAVSCLSGRTALYRRKILTPEILNGMVNECFMGKQVQSGEDKFLTEAIQKRGGKTFYQASAVIYPRVASDPLTLIKQRLRWSRNSWRSDLRAFRDGWVWKRKALSFHLLDRAFAPFTLMMGFIFFVFAIVQEHWPVVIALFLWWMLSRILKSVSHFWHHPKDLLIAPLYVVWTFVNAILKIHALVTLHHMSWMTRWSSERLSVFRPTKLWARIIPFVETLAILSLLVIVVWWMQ